MPKSILKLERDIQVAAESARFDDMQLLAATLCAAAAQRTNTMAAGDPEIALTAIKIDEVLDSCLLTVRAARAAMAAELERAAALSRYARRQDSAASTINLHLDV